MSLCTNSLYYKIIPIHSSHPPRWSWQWLASRLPQLPRFPTPTQPTLLCLINISKREQWWVRAPKSCDLWTTPAHRTCQLPQIHLVKDVLFSFYKEVWCHTEGHTAHEILNSFHLQYMLPPAQIKIACFFIVYKIKEKLTLAFEVLPQLDPNQPLRWHLPLSPCLMPLTRSKVKKKKKKWRKRREIKKTLSRKAIILPQHKDILSQNLVTFLLLVKKYILKAVFSLAL